MCVRESIILVKILYDHTCNEDCIHGFFFKCSAAYLGTMVKEYNLRTDSRRTTTLVDNPSEHFGTRKEGFLAPKPHFQIISLKKNFFNENCTQDFCFECSAADLGRMTQNFI